MYFVNEEGISQCEFFILLIQGPADSLKESIEGNGIKPAYAVVEVESIEKSIFDSSLPNLL